MIFYLVQIGCFGQISFSETPKNLQLFARENDNSAIVNYKGNVQWTGFRKISLFVTRDDTFFSKQNIDLPNGYSDFSFQFQTKIYATPHEYKFRVFLHTSIGDSLEVTSGTRERIVCGDFYVLYGQSNILALAAIEDVYSNYDDRLLRNFGNHYGEQRVETLSWFSSKNPFAHVGGIGMYLQKEILAKHGIPTCVINGGQGGYNIDMLSDRQSDNPGNISTSYGQLYNRVIHAKAYGKIKGVVWRQGENEACSSDDKIEAYPAKFANLYNFMRTDFGNWVKFYNIQLPIQGCNFLESAGALREYMRKTKYIFDAVETITAIGVPTADGIHHSKEGNMQLSEELFQLIQRDVYKAPAKPELHPPDIQKAYKSDGGTTLTLEFEEGQAMKYPADTIIASFLWQMKNYFFINCPTSECTTIINEGRTEGNKVILKLGTSINGGFVTYLPSYSRHERAQQNIHLTNSRGLRALSFYKFQIADKLSTPVIDSVVYAGGSQVRLFFRKSSTTIIERKISTQEGFVEIARITDGSYLDYFNTENIAGASYRIKKTSEVSASDYSAVVEVQLNDCINSNLKLSGVTDSSMIQKGQKIQSTQKVTAPAVKYFFKRSVELQAGFETGRNTTFLVSADGCPN